MKNNITSKYLWKHSTLYPFPMIFDISLNVHLVIPMGKKEHKKIHVVMVHLRIQLRRTKNVWSVIERHQVWNELHQKFPFYHSKHCFFSNSMSLSDVLSENLLPPPYIYIYTVGGFKHFFVFHFIYGVILPIDFHIFKMVKATNQYAHIHGYIVSYRPLIN